VPFYGDGEPSPIVGTLAHVPEVLEVTMPFVGVVLGASAIEARTTELVIVRTSARLGCRYCVQTHSVIALDSGVSAQEVRALCGGGALVEAFEASSERALLAWVDAVAGGRGAVAPEIGAALRAHWSEAETVELTLLCSATMMLNRYCSALALPTRPATLRRLAAERLT
jgi:AhpD family alkylhydroperoxidase